MKLNMGIADRVVRFIIAIALTILYLTGVIPGTIGIILMIVAFIFTLTSLSGFCPLYTLFRVKRWER